MRLEIGNRRTQVVDPPDKALETIIKLSTIKWQQYQKRRGAPHPEVRTRSLSYYRRETFPSGWAGRIYRALREEGFSPELVDLREKPKINPLGIVPVFPHERRDYQEEAISLAIRKTRGIISHPTGTGKTLTAGVLVAVLEFPKTIYLVPNLELLRQTRDEFQAWFPNTEIGVLGDRSWKPERITIATPNIIWKRIASPETRVLLDEVECLIIDEAHHVNIAGYGNRITNTWFRIGLECQAYWKFGFSATPGDPGSPERMLLEAVTGGILHHYSSGDAIRAGYLSQPEIRIYTIEIPNRISEWPKAYEENLTLNKERNKKIIDLAKAYARKGKTVLINVDRVEKHGVLLEKLVGRDGIFVWSQTKREERIRAKELIKEKKIKILIGTIYGEGVDIPSLDVVINAAGGKKNRRTIQKMGRVLRKAEGKTEGIILDFYDKDGDWRVSSAGRDYYSPGLLEKQSKQRLKVYKSDPAFRVTEI